MKKILAIILILMMINTANLMVHFHNSSFSVHYIDEKYNSESKSFNNFTIGKINSFSYGYNLKCNLENNDLKDLTGCSQDYYNSSGFYILTSQNLLNFSLLYNFNESYFYSTLNLTITFSNISVNIFTNYSLHCFAYIYINKKFLSDPIQLTSNKYYNFSIITNKNYLSLVIYNSKLIYQKKFNVMGPGNYINTTIYSKYYYVKMVKISVFNYNKGNEISNNSIKSFSLKLNNNSNVVYVPSIHEFIIQNQRYLYFENYYKNKKIIAKTNITNLKNICYFQSSYDVYFAYHFINYYIVYIFSKENGKLLKNITLNYRNRSFLFLYNNSIYILIQNTSYNIINNKTLNFKIKSDNFISVINYFQDIILIRYPNYTCYFNLLYKIKIKLYNINISSIYILNSEPFLVISDNFIFNFTTNKFFSKLDFSNYNCISFFHNFIILRDGNQYGILERQFHFINFVSDQNFIYIFNNSCLVSLNYKIFNYPTPTIEKYYKILSCGFINLNLSCNSSYTILIRVGNWFNKYNSSLLLIKPMNLSSGVYDIEFKIKYYFGVNQTYFSELFYQKSLPKIINCNYTKKIFSNETLKFKISTKIITSILIFKINNELYYNYSMNNNCFTLIVPYLKNVSIIRISITTHNLLNFTFVYSLSFNYTQFIPSIESNVKNNYVYNTSSVKFCFKSFEPLLTNIQVKLYSKIKNLYTVILSKNLTNAFLFFNFSNNGKYKIVFFLDYFDQILKKFSYNFSVILTEPLIYISGRLNKNYSFFGDSNLNHFKINLTANMNGSYITIIYRQNIIVYENISFFRNLTINSTKFSYLFYINSNYKLQIRFIGINRLSKVICFNFTVNNSMPKPLIRSNFYLDKNLLNLICYYPYYNISNIKFQLKNTSEYYLKNETIYLNKTGIYNIQLIINNNYENYIIENITISYQNEKPQINISLKKENKCHLSFLISTNSKIKCLNISSNCKFEISNNSVYVNPKRDGVLYLNISIMDFCGNGNFENYSLLIKNITCIKNVLIDSFYLITGWKAEIKLTGECLNKTKIKTYLNGKPLFSGDSGFIPSDSFAEQFCVLVSYDNKSIKKMEIFYGISISLYPLIFLVFIETIMFQKIWENKDKEDLINILRKSDDISYKKVYRSLRNMWYSSKSIKKAIKKEKKKGNIKILTDPDGKKRIAILDDKFKKS